MLKIKLQTSSGKRSAATPAGKATAEDPRRVVFSSVAEVLPAESVRTERSQTVSYSETSWFAVYVNSGYFIVNLGNVSPLYLMPSKLNGNFYSGRVE